MFKIALFLTLFPLSLFALDSNLPTWVEDVYSECVRFKELCAIGEGPSVTLAETNAKISLAQIFQTQIKSKIETYKHSWQKDFDQGSVLEEFEQEQSLLSDEVLEGVSIKKTVERDESHFFALASLNKRSISESWEKQMNQLEDQMVILMEDSKKSSLIKLKQLFIKREKINLRYNVLHEKFFSTKFTYKNIENKERLLKPSEVQLVFKSATAAKELAGFINKLFLENGYTVKLKDKTKYKVTVAIESKKLYFNVEGFEKYQFQINLVSFDENTKKLGSIFHELTDSGRSDLQVEEKLLPQFKEYIKEHIADLNIP